MLIPTSWWIAVEPIDLRRGMDGLLTAIAMQFGHDGLAGGAYVFRNRSGTRIKVGLTIAAAAAAGKVAWPDGYVHAPKSNEPDRPEGIVIDG